MAGDLHIDDFYRDTAIILLRLYSSFPRRTAIYIDEVSGPDTPDEFGLPSPRTQACFATALWLAENGYLDVESTQPHQALDQTVLTEKGFLALTARDLPSESGNRKPALLVERLRQALAQGSFAIADAVQAILRRPPIASNRF